MELRPQNTAIHRRRVRTARLCALALVIALASAFAILAAFEVKDLVYLAMAGMVTAATIFAVATMTRPRHRKELMA